jgi:hypothetical protein
MAFDINTARPENAPQSAMTGFDINTAKPEAGDGKNVVNNVSSNNNSLPVDSSQPVESTIGQDIVGGLETAATIASSAIAEPVAGLAGLVTAPFAGVDEAVKNIESLRSSLTYSPKSEAGKDQIKAIGAAISPVSKGMKKVESALGSSVLEATGSPGLAAIAHSLPTAALELIGVKGLRGAKLKNVKLSDNVAKAITQSAPDIAKLKKATSDAYKELDNLGIKIKPNVYDQFAGKLEAKLKREGLKLGGASEQLFPKSSSAIKTIISEKGVAKTAGDLETIRKVAASAAKSIDPPDARLGSIMVDEIDGALDSLASTMGGKFKNARALAQRGFKSQAVTDMIENASHTASGLENGLRIEARKILKSKKKRRGFSEGELNALREIEQGTSASNTAKLLGKFGLSEGQATSMLGASIGIGGGGAIGASFGPVGAAVGALTVPMIGQIAKNTAQRITLNSAKFADDLYRSGKNSKDVTKAYLKHTPKSKRSVSDLTDILMDTSLNPADIRSLPSSSSGVGKLVSDSVHFAKEIRRKAAQAGSAGLISTPTIEENNNGS